MSRTSPAGSSISAAVHEAPGSFRGQGFSAELFTSHDQMNEENFDPLTSCLSLFKFQIISGNIIIGLINNKLMRFAEIIISRL